MPTEFQKYITIDIKIPVRRKPNGVFEARYRAHGFNFCVSSCDFDKLKPKFLHALAVYFAPAPSAPAASEEKSLPTFRAVGARWLELKRPEIKEKTFAFYVQILGASIFPVFEGRQINEIKQSDIKELVNGYMEQGKYRTATKIYQTLNAIFNFAVGDDLLERSPMRLLKPPKYEEQTGVALTIAEETELLRRINECNCIPEVKNALLFLLYTGIRRSELASAYISDGFIIVTCSKVRKGFQDKKRRIPITPMLWSYLPQMNLETFRAVRPDALTQAMKRLFPAHHLHELRHTFITRCQECGVPREVVSVWAGHAADNSQTSLVYTHFSADFMKKEAQKVVYELKKGE